MASDRAARAEEIRLRIIEMAEAQDAAIKARQAKMQEHLKLGHCVKVRLIHCLLAGKNIPSSGPTWQSAWSKCLAGVLSQGQLAWAWDRIGSKLLSAHRQGHPYKPQALMADVTCVADLHTESYQKWLWPAIDLLLYHRSLRNAHNPICTVVRH